MSTPTYSRERPRLRAVKLALVGQQDRTVAFPVAPSDGVDLGSIGRLLGLEPTTVRLNGHFLSRGPRHVSSVTWGSLLSFFSARGFPVGASDRDPIVVQGKPAPAGAYCDFDLEDGDHLSFKRKVTLEGKSPTKKNRLFVDNSDAKKVAESFATHDDEEESLCFERRLKLDDNLPSKKLKTSHCNQGLRSKTSNTSPVPSRIGFTYNCISELGKRSREDEVVVPVSCKRIK